MRPIDSTIQNRLLQTQQTAYNNAEPKMEIVAVRPRTAIFHERYWQESIVTAGVTAVCTSVAIRRTGRWGDTIFVAYVDNSGVLTVKSAPFRFPIRALSWTTQATIPGCSACALEFEGRFVHVGKNVEFRTNATPFLYYVTTGGALIGGLLGSTYETLANSGVTAVDAINGVSNTYGAQDQGFFVFYITNGSVYYNTFLGGEWLGQQAVGIAPANAVAIKAERTFDYRVVLQVKDSSGALWEVFGRMEATGWNGTEYVELLSVSATAEMVRVNYIDTAQEEYVELSASSDAWNMSIYSPTLLRAWNIATSVEDSENLGTFYDDYGYRVVFEFDQCIKNADLFPADFKLTDSYNATWYGQSVQMDSHSRFVTVTFTDFNNAGNSVTATALAGNLWNGLTMLTETSKSFDATGLVPTFVPAPVVTGITNTDNRTIRLAFDRPIISIDAGIGLTVAGVEPFASPAGQLVPTTYAIEDVTMAEPAIMHTEDFTAGTLAGLAIISGVLQLGEV